MRKRERGGRRDREMVQGLGLRVEGFERQPPNRASRTRGPTQGLVVHGRIGTEHYILYTAAEELKLQSD